jgi:hypothetical protein
MKINSTRIKNWDFKTRILEIERRLHDINDYSALLPDEVTIKLDEIRKIVSYWRKHMKGRDQKSEEVKIIHKPKKPMNLWDS